MIYRFGAFTLDTRTCELECDGQAVAVEPEVFGVLHDLIANRDRVVSRDDLISDVWKGRIVSDATLSSRISAARIAVGDTGDEQAIIRTLPRRGFRFVADVEEVAIAPPASGNPAPVAGGTEPERRQKVQFCRSADGTGVASATIGEGYPLVRAGHFLTHLEYDWNSPLWRPFLNELASRFQVIRYDQRGIGLSDWSVANWQLDRFVEDLEAVVDAAGIDRFALYGTSQGAPISIAYAMRHPDRVSHLLLQGGYAQGRLVRDSFSEREQGEAMLTLIRHGWGKQGSPFLRAFSSMFIPGGTAEQISSLTELQRRSTTAENAALLREAVDRFDVSDLLEHIRVPTLVIHARDDGVQPLDEGRKLASGIPGAEFLMLESGNHVLVQHEPAWPAYFEALEHFVAD